MRQRLVAGESDKQVMDFIVARYGDFVLLKPPLNAETLALWIGPGVLFLFSASAAFLFLRRRRVSEPLPLGEEEKRRLARMIEEDS